MDLDFGQDSEELKKLEVSKSTSKLDKAIQELISIIFDIESMKKAMIEFEVRCLACQFKNSFKSVIIGLVSRVWINSGL